MYGVSDDEDDQGLSSLSVRPKDGLRGANGGLGDVVDRMRQNASIQTPKLFADTTARIPALVMA